MEYSPISERRVLLAFGTTGFVAVIPALFLYLQAGHAGALSPFADAGGSYRGLVLGAGSAVLTAVLIGALMLTVALGRRMVRRPSRA